jgi:hypothetical protein
MTPMNDRAASDGARYSTATSIGRMSLRDAAVMAFLRRGVFDPLSILF